jgi:nitrate reductase gamma subunit
MATSKTIFDLFSLFWFAILPYVAIVVFLFITIQRYTNRGFTYSSLSSQFLENKLHFWGLVPFHYGILTVLTGHFIAFLIPGEIIAWNSRPLRLYVLEIFAFIAAFLALFGLINIVIRRITDDRTRVVTSALDWVVLAVIIFQIITGMGIAIFNSWGSSWFASSLAPYLWSILKLNPDISYVRGLPILPKLHIINAYIFVLLFPFTRLVHMLVVPNPYLWRKPQLVRWYWNRKKIRIAE